MARGSFRLSYAMYVKKGRRGQAYTGGCEKKCSAAAYTLRRLRLPEKGMPAQSMVWERRERYGQESSSA